MKNNLYFNNPLIHKDRCLANNSNKWVQSFDCTHINPLIICRGPIRKEAMDVFTEMGIENFGVLISQKDSIVYQNTIMPELRQLTSDKRIHRVPDYTGSDKKEREERIQQIIKIALDNGYNAIFSGYGFMAEDETMVSSIENAGLNFIGPCSKTVHDAGLKDEAKRIAMRMGVSVTPGIDNATALTLLKNHKTEKALRKLIKAEDLEVDQTRFDLEKKLEDKAELILAAGYKKGIDLYSIEQLQTTICEQVKALNIAFPDNRLRLKFIGGGGGKGQRILPSPATFHDNSCKGLEERVDKVAELVPSLVLEILNEVKATGQGDNKNILIEMNIENIRHQEIQVLGNGVWTLALGGRDCSLQMHEQKLLEVSVTTEDLEASLNEAVKSGCDTEAKVLKQDIKTLKEMEEQAEFFGEAVGLNNVSTFECIIDRDNHFFMEMNTRIQVEHRVTELCYSLKFINPDNITDFFTVDSLIEAMVLLAVHGPRLPKPERQLRNRASVEARLNASNHSLSPHAGGTIEYWSDNHQYEIRDDQGISLPNPDTGMFMKYHLAGAYDSNIALLLTAGENRYSSYSRMAEVLRVTKLEGENLATNLDFHYGLINWFIGNNINARPNTRYIVPYLTAVGLLKDTANHIDLKQVYKSICNTLLSREDDVNEQASLSAILNRKQLLLKRPIQYLMEEPHVLSGWLSLNRMSFSVDDKGNIYWIENPIKVLASTYHFLNMEYRTDGVALNMIWDHDHEILNQALEFYRSLEEKLGISDFLELEAALNAERAPVNSDFKQDVWQAAKAAHKGYQAGNEVLSILPYLGISSNFYDLKVNKDLTIHIPDVLLDEALQKKMMKVLAPPPVAKTDEILAPSGGMFYASEGPGLPPFVKEGMHFNVGEPLCIIEVMKMFNKVQAPFSGTIDKVLIEEDGAILTKGQTLFKITPDEIVIEESAKEKKSRIAKQTDKLLESI